jgi:hypothetical protein
MTKARQLRIPDTLEAMKHSIETTHGLDRPDSQKVVEHAGIKAE